MRYERTASFKADYRRLSSDEQALFRRAARAFSVACDRHADDPGSAAWPATLRVKAVRGATGVWEMTWSLAGPDGRATWEWTTVTVTIDGRATQARAVRWRRVGGHAIFDAP